MPVWGRCAHVQHADTQFNITMRTVSGDLRSTHINWLPVFSNIEPPQIRRDRATLQEYKKAQQLTDRVPIKEILRVCVCVCVCCVYVCQCRVSLYGRNGTCHGPRALGARAPGKITSRNVVLVFIVSLSSVLMRNGILGRFHNCSFNCSRYNRLQHIRENIRALVEFTVHFVLGLMSSRLKERLRV